MSYATVKEEKKRVDFDIYILSCQKTKTKKTKNEILKIKEKNIEMSGSICKSAILNIFVRLLYISLNFVLKKWK